jgi:hypothetical protein
MMSAYDQLRPARLVARLHVAPVEAKPQPEEEALCLLQRIETDALVSQLSPLPLFHPILTCQSLMA